MSEHAGRWDYEYLVVENDHGVLTCTLNRPEVLNAVHGPMHHELTRFFHRLVEDDPDDDVEVVILTGAGRGFCSGGDIKAPMGRPNRRDGEPPDPTWHPLRGFAVGSPMMRALISVTQPVIAAVNGDAVGMGASVALCCDVVLAAESARIGDPHVPSGLVAGDGGALIWPMLVGPNIAKEYLMTGDLIPARVAERLGLVNHVYSDDSLMDEARQLARRLRDTPRAAVRWTKQLVNRLLFEQMGTVTDAGLALERVTQLAPGWSPPTR